VHASDDRATPQGASVRPRHSGERATDNALSSFTAERLRLLESAVVNSYDSIVITDAGTPESPRPRIVFVNQAFTRLSGYSADEAVGRSPSILQGPASDPAEIDRMRHSLARGEVFTAELVNYRKDGRPFHVEARIMPIRDQTGRLSHWVGVQRDITARKHAAAEREKLEHRLREKQKLESLGVLAGGIAHDFNNLLTIILGNASLARLDSRSPESVEQNLRFIESAAIRAADLCRQMLAYSGKGRYVVRPVDLNTVLRETADLVRSAAARGRTLQLELAAHLAAIRADATQLQQVAMNLLLNAAEATEPGTGTIRVSTCSGHVDAARLARMHLGADLPSGEYVVLELADNGCGIPREIQARIFDPFFTTKFTGRGLGLAAVLGIVRAHSGAIEVESEPGHGATFRLYLPACAEPVATPPPPSAAPAFPNTERTILIVDDEQVLRETMRDLLQRLGYTVFLAADGAAAVELYRLRHAEIDAVLLDLSMPVLDGAAAFDAMRAIASEPLIILMSGYSQDEAVQRFEGRGIAGFLQKPFAVEALLSTLATVLADR
jgi:PAS domain S-box-containing protein